MMPVPRRISSTRRARSASSAAAASARAAATAALASASWRHASAAASAAAVEPRIMRANSSCSVWSSERTLWYAGRASIAASHADSRGKAALPRRLSPRNFGRPLFGLFGRCFGAWEECFVMRVEKRG